MNILTSIKEFFTRPQIIPEEILEEPLTQQNSIPINFELNLLIISDTHGCLTEKDLPMLINQDACFILGDLSASDLDTIDSLVTPYVPTYYVMGNHDGSKLYEHYEMKNLHGKTVTIEGVRVAGMQGSIRYKNGDYVMYSDIESVEIANNMQPADILISHDSPKYLHREGNNPHSGLQGITEYCINNNVPLNLHGHHHDNSHYILGNGTQSICCYKVVELNTKERLLLWKN